MNINVDRIRNNGEYGIVDLIDSLNDIQYQVEKGTMTASDGLSLANKCCNGFLSSEDNNPISDWESEGSDDPFSGLEDNIEPSADEYENIQREAFKFLDDLRESGRVNMFGATSHLEEHFGYTTEQCKTLLKEWMQQYGK